MTAGRALLYVVASLVPAAVVICGLLTIGAVFRIPEAPVPVSNGAGPARPYLPEQRATAIDRCTLANGLVDRECYDRAIGAR